jgi:hypothetical protein
MRTPREVTGCCTERTGIASISASTGIQVKEGTKKDLHDPIVALPKHTPPTHIHLLVRQQCGSRRAHGCALVPPANRADTGRAYPSIASTRPGFRPRPNPRRKPTLTALRPTLMPDRPRPGTLLLSPDPVHRVACAHPRISTRHCALRSVSSSPRRAPDA